MPLSEAPGRESSSVVSARYQFITANPTIDGEQPGGHHIDRPDTSNAVMWYTLDGSTPVATGRPVWDPSPNGTVLSINVKSNTTINVRGVCRQFRPQRHCQRDAFARAIFWRQSDFWFHSGEASSEFIGAAGQRFMAPVTLTLIPSATTFIRFSLTWR